eukprot:TRINITY_DN1928_c0_g1_i4.p1 TRINITY_DN1928_c0_g1~~TRINITY_DN1928_c0_g1_i4.p1  ORF type:complete len:323 (+),score=36.56 TRINITY_DN1928_c0_g1_i4:388-1356(+)
MELNVSVKNTFGRAEKFSTSLTYGVTKSSSFRVSAFWPLYYKTIRGEGIDIRAFRAKYPHLVHSCHTESKTGAIISYIIGRHRLSYEWCWRDIILGKTPTEPLLSEGGHSIKSSVKYEYSVDSRDDHLTPMSGTAFRFAQEFAGLAGDVSFIKNEIDLQHNWPVGPPDYGWSINWVLKAGLLIPLNRNKKSMISDRFFLGGPTDFRGFEFKGLGPRLGNDSFGGDMLGVSSLHFTWPVLYTRTGLSLKSHLYTQIGNLISLKEDAGIGNLVSMMEHYRMSVGGGLILRYGPLRFELNLSHPLRKEESDITKAFQLGFALRFS